MTTTKTKTDGIYMGLLMMVMAGGTCVSWLSVASYQDKKEMAWWTTSIFILGSRSLLDWQEKTDLIQDHQDGPGYLLLLVLRLRRFSSLAYRHGMDGLMQKHIKHKAHGCQAWPFGDILLTSLRLYNTTHFPSRKIDPWFIGCWLLVIIYQSFVWPWWIFVTWSHII